MKLIERDHHLNRRKDTMGTPDIKVIAGVRRCGKSKPMESFINFVRANDPHASIVHINFHLSASEKRTEYHALHDYVEKAYRPERTTMSSSTKFRSARVSRKQ